MAKKTSKSNKKSAPGRPARSLTASDNGRELSDDSNVEPLTSAGEGARVGDSLEKVRDILFGHQQRDTDRRFSGLESRLGDELNVLRDEFRKRLDSLEEFAKREIVELADRLKGEQQRSSQAVKDLTAQHKDDVKNLDRAHTDQLRQMDKAHTETMKDLDKRLKAAADAGDAGDAELRKELLDQSTALRDEVQSARSELTETINRLAADLRDSKADRSAIAEMFSEMALRIAGE